jgi:acetoin utilization deacetylase AcuC-like enzyme
MRTQKIKTFYDDCQVLAQDSYSNYSKSPLKPKLLLEYFEQKGLYKHFSVTNDFVPYSKKDFKLAHEAGYINEFFKGTGRCSSNGLAWSKQFADSVRYTNASLHAAIRNSIVNPAEVSFSPTSGFHHARPSGGSGFCTFSGQVIASLKIYKEFGARGAYLDLDGHFGNSIEDSRLFCKDLNLAVPQDFNINPIGIDSDYLADLAKWLERLKHAIIADKIQYVVWCHGADSHADDNLGSQCETDYWVACSTLFWSWVKEMDGILGRPLSVSCALFGGYRDDDYTSVLSLHTADFVECFTKLLDLDVKYTIEVKPRLKMGYYNDTLITRKRKRARKRMDQEI